MAGQSTPLASTPCIWNTFSRRTIWPWSRQVRFEAVFEVLIRGLLDHVGKVLGDLLLRIIDVPQRVHEQVVEGLYVFCKKAHGFLLGVVSEANHRHRIEFPGVYNRLISWARMTISSWSARAPAVRAGTARRPGQVRSAMTSTTAMLSFSVAAAALPKTLTGGPQKAGRAAELFRQLFQKSLEPFLGDRLAVAGLLRQEDLHEIGERAHEALRSRAARASFQARFAS